MFRKRVSSRSAKAQLNAFCFRAAKRDGPLPGPLRGSGSYYVTGIGKDNPFHFTGEEDKNGQETTGGPLKEVTVCWDE